MIKGDKKKHGKIVTSLLLLVCPTPTCCSNVGWWINFLQTIQGASNVNLVVLYLTTNTIITACFRPPQLEFGCSMWFAE